MVRGRDGVASRRRCSDDGGVRGRRAEEENTLVGENDRQGVNVSDAYIRRLPRRCWWGSKSPASFPPTVPLTGSPFPPPGPSGGFPGFSGTKRSSDFLPSLPPRFVAFARRYQARSLVRSVDVERYGPTGLDTLTGCPVRLVAGDVRTSQVPGKPQCTHAAFSDSGEASAPGRVDPTALRCGLPRFARCRPSQVRCDFEAQRAAYPLPVYASQPGAPPHHATLGSGWSPPFAGRDRPAGFDRRFQFAINLLLLQASPGARKAAASGAASPVGTVHHHRGPAGRCPGGG